ncbi:MAG: sulfatase [Acidobacteria bacterium]|nr:sulfatase [Acidobacteriota bacterium]MCI0719007.1 sulfatase [Acidobacteriota bacterium]
MNPTHILLSLALLFASPIFAGVAQSSARHPPNVVIILADDLGYADIGPFGATQIKTPNLDRMAKEGRRFTGFYSAQAVCTASRTALLTGCYPNRLGLHGALGPSSRHGINDHETTLAELVKQRNYATAIFGKWHLGHHPQFLPTRHGFDEYFGLPYSNDMWPNNREASPDAYPPLPLVEHDRVIQTMPDQTQLSRWYTERAVKFIDRHKTRPFFLYVPHSMPHVPLHVSDQFKSKSQQGLYGDVIEEIDWSLGQILAALKRNSLDDNTLVIFTSDNGPWLSYGNHAGSAWPLREGKATTWEGGVRVPCLMRFPGKIPAGSVSAQPLMTIDLLPTIARLINTELPKHTIDGRDMWPYIIGDPKRKHPHEAYFFYFENNELQAVMSGRWKLYLPHAYYTLGGQPGGRDGRRAEYQERKLEGAELYDLESDISETANVAEKQPEVVKRLEALAEKSRAELGDSLTARTGKGVREPGRLTEPK